MYYFLVFTDFLFGKCPAFSVRNGGFSELVA
jgi:hypothetical protein